MVDLILEIELFDHKCVIIKGLLQSDRLKQHMVSIGADQSLSSSAMYEHRCLVNINKLYKISGKCDDQK